MNSATVAAVIVTEGDTPFLRYTLQAVRNSTRRPDSIVIIDWSSPEAQHHITPDVIRKHKLRAYLVEVLDPLSLGEAIVRGLDGLPIDEDYLWILHDDSAPREDALENLLQGISLKEGVTVLPDGVAGGGEQSIPKPIGVVGATHYMWGEDLRLQSVGIVVSPHSTRLIDIEPGEIDQGQYSDRCDMYAVDTAGMLVRSDLWEELGGFSSYTPIYGADIEFCRRAHLAGYRVIVIPDAVIYHAQASFNGIRHKQDSLLAKRKLADVKAPTEQSNLLAASARWKSYRARRQAQLFNWAVGLPKWLFPISGLIALILGIMRAFFCLLTKNVPGARAEMSAAIGFIGRYSEVSKARASIERTSTENPSRLQTLGASSSQRWQHIRRWWSSDTTRQRFEPLDPLAAKHLSQRLQKAHIVTGLLAIIGLLAGLIAMRGWFNPMAGGAWATVPQTWSELWQSAWATWTVGGDGYALAADPVLGVLAIVCAPFALFSISPNTVLNGIFILMPCFAVLGAWWGFSAISRQIPARFMMALAWMLWPAFLISLWHGNFTSALAHVLIPVFIWGVAYASGFGATDIVSGALSDVGVTSQYRMTTGAGIAALASAGLMATNLFLGLLAAIVMVFAAIAGQIAHRLWRRRVYKGVESGDEKSIDKPLEPKVKVESGSKEESVEDSTKELAEDSEKQSSAARLKHEGASFADAADKQYDKAEQRTSSRLSVEIYDPLQLRHSGAAGLWLSALVPFIVAMPTLIGLIQHPQAFTYALAYTSGAPNRFSTATFYEALLGSPLALSDMKQLHSWLISAWVIFAGSIVILAIYGLFKLYRGTTIRLGWIIAIVGAGAVGLVRHVVVTALPSGEGASIVHVTAWPAVFQSLMWAGLVIAAGASVHRMFDTNPLMRFSAMRITAVALAICVATTGLVVGVGWVASSTQLLYSTTDKSYKNGVDAAIDNDQRLNPVDHQWPKIVTDDKAASQLAASSGRLSRLLEITPVADGEVSLRVYRLDAPALTDSSVLVSWLHTHNQYDDADKELATSVAAMTRGHAPDVDNVLARHGIEFLISPLCQTPTCQQLQAGLESNDSIERILIGDTNTTWRVVGTNSSIARVNLVDMDKTTPINSDIVEVRAAIEGSKNSRTIQMAERFDPGWQARLSGVHLAAHSKGWQQTFDIPAHAKGNLEITYRHSWQWVWWLASALAIIISTIGALPLRSRREV